MRLPSSFRAVGPFLAAAVLAGPAWAGWQSPGAIVAERIEDAPAVTTPDAKAHFKCELKPFDLSQGLFCYGPAAIRAAYNLGKSDGAGETIVILDAYGSPTALSDIQAFDKIFGIADPPSFKVVTMPGTPAWNPKDHNMVGWAEETSLDLQWAHAIAPGANIVLVAAASNNDDDLTAGLNYALDNRLGSVVSMSFGESEVWLQGADGAPVIAGWEAAFKKARQQRVTLFVSSGDQGATNTNATDVFPFRNVSYPASSPQVTAVGGTNLFFGTATNANPNGTYQGEQVWNDYAAGGGGVSVLFGEPDYQHEGLPQSVQSQLGGMRGIPDVAYNAGIVGGVIVHLGFFGANFIFGGTSAGAPQWAGVVAGLNQVAGAPLGFINQRLYRAGKFGVNAGLFHDVTVGNNTWDDGVVFVQGYDATPGWDLATGYGTPNFGAAGTVFSDPGDQGHPAQ